MAVDPWRGRPLRNFVLRAFVILPRGVANPLYEQFKRLDNAVYRAERMLVVASLLIMALVVFLDVVHRGFAGEASKFAELSIGIAGLFGMLPAKDDPTYAAEAATMTTTMAAASPYMQFVIYTALGYFGIRSVKRTEPVPAPTAAMYSVAGVLASYGAVRLLIWAMPNGLIWSQPMALVLTLWVGFIGASMCTYEAKHLKVEAVQRSIPDKFKPLVGFLSGAMTTVVCLLLFWVSLRYVIFSYDGYVETQGRGGLIEGWGIPKYQGYAALPIAFMFMSLRFASRAVLAAQGKFKEVDPLGLDKDKGPGPLPSDVETEAVRASSPGREPDAPAPSEVDTITSRGSGQSAAAQSKVATDPDQAVRSARSDEPKATSGRISDSKDDHEPPANAKADAAAADDSEDSQ